MKKLLSNEIGFTLNYTPSDIRYEPEIPPAKYDPGTPATAWLVRATVEGTCNDDGEEVKAPQWMLDYANDNAMFENQLIQEVEADLREWDGEKESYEYEWKCSSICEAKWCGYKTDEHADYFGGIKRVSNG
jgi:hypothetical protein